MLKRLLLEDVLRAGHVDRPAELISLCFVVYFLDGYTMFLAPVYIKNKNK